MPPAGAVLLAAHADPTPAEVEAALETLMHVHRLQLDAARAAGRLQGVLGASCGLMHLYEAAGPALAAAAFARACGQ